jgi:hypothetical protein
MVGFLGASPNERPHHGIGSDGTRLRLGLAQSLVISSRVSGFDSLFLISKGLRECMISILTGRRA